MFIRCPECGKTVGGEFTVGQDWPAHLFGPDGNTENCPYPDGHKLAEEDTFVPDWAK